MRNRGAVAGDVDLGAGAGSGREALPKHLVLALGIAIFVVIAPEGDQEFVGRRGEGDRRIAGVVGSVAVGAEVADAEVVVAGGIAAAAVAGDELPIHLFLAVLRVVAVPHHQVGRRIGAVHDVRLAGVNVSVAIGAHVADPEVVVADLVAAAAVTVEALPEDFFLAAGEATDLIAALPDDEVLVVRWVVGHGRRFCTVVERAVSRIAHIADPEVVVADLVALAAVTVDALPEDLELAVLQPPNIVVAVPHHEVFVVGGVVGHVCPDERAVVAAARWPHVADEEVRVAHLLPLRLVTVEALPIDLALEGAIDRTDPRHEVFVVD